MASSLPRWRIDASSAKRSFPAPSRATSERIIDSISTSSLTLSGTTYTIQDGKLLDKAGKEAGSVDNLGNYQLTGEKTPSSYYDDVHARVLLKEGEGKEARTLLETLAPTHVTLPGGRRVEVTYAADAPPSISSRLQDFFGMKDGPRVAGGGSGARWLRRPRSAPRDVRSQIHSILQSQYVYFAEPQRWSRGSSTRRTTFPVAQEQQKPINSISY